MTKKYDLTNNEIAIISYLSGNTADTASDIVNELLFSKSHISLSVDTLAKNEIEAIFFRDFSESEIVVLQSLIQRVVDNIKDSTLLK